MDLDTKIIELPQRVYLRRPGKKSQPDRKQTATRIMARAVLRHGDKR